LLSRKLCALLGLAAFAASLGACAQNLPVDRRIVTNENAQTMIRDVDASTLSAEDKRAFRSFIQSNERRQEAYEGKTVREVINAETAFETGKRLELADRASDAARRKAMARLISLDVKRIVDAARGINLTVSATNRTRDAVTGFEAGLEVDDARSHKRLGLAELHVARTVPPGGRVTFAYPMRYVRFGEDTGAMRLAAGTPKTAHLDVFAVNFAHAHAIDDD